jgi:hypothetical protein
MKSRTYSRCEIERIGAAAAGAHNASMALIRKRASVSRPSGEWGDDDYDMLARLPDQPAPREACRITIKPPA